MLFDIIEEHNKEDLEINNKITALQDEIEKLHKSKEELLHKQQEKLNNKVKEIIPPDYTLVHLAHWHNFYGNRLRIVCYHKEHIVKLSIQDETNETPSYLIEYHTLLLNVPDINLHMPESALKLAQTFKDYIQKELEKNNQKRLYSITNDLVRLKGSVDTMLVTGEILDIYRSLQSGESIEKVALLYHRSENGIKAWINS